MLQLLLITGLLVGSCLGVTVTTDEDLIVNEGRNAVLQCSYTLDSREQFSAFVWLFRGEQVFKFTGGVASTGGVLAGRGATRLGDSASIEVTGVSVEDQGEWQCQVITTDINIAVSTVNLQVRTFPEIADVYKTPNSDLNLGDRLSLTCLAKGDPLPSIHWLHNNEKTEFKSANVTIDKVSIDHMGEWWCLAENSVGKKQSPKLTVKINHPPRSMNVAPFKESYPGAREARLQCEFSAYPLIDKFTWEKLTEEGSWEGLGESKQSNVLVPYVSRRVTELLLSPVFEEDLGTYRCTARNSVGQGDATIKLIRGDPVTEPKRDLLTTPKESGASRQIGTASLVLVIAFFAT